MFCFEQVGRSRLLNAELLMAKSGFLSMGQGRIGAEIWPVLYAISHRANLTLFVRLGSKLICVREIVHYMNSIR